MSRGEILDRQVPPALLWALAILALTLAGQWLQSQVHLNHDVSYFVHFDRWLLQGRTLGSDLLDGNLPMVWVLFMPAAALAQANLLSEASAVQLVFWAYFLVSTVLLVSVLSRLESRNRAASIGWVAGFVLVATLAPGFSFGQREHACVLFSMPYLAAAVLRLQGAGSAKALRWRSVCLRHRLCDQAVFSGCLRWWNCCCWRVSGGDRFSFASKVSRSDSPESRMS